MSNGPVAVEQYRHGVLVGNWNEDQFGADLTRNNYPTAVAADKAFYTSEHADQFSNVTPKLEPAPYPAALREVEKEVLFSHSDPPKEPIYTTTYNASWNVSRGALPHPIASRRRSARPVEQSRWQSTSHAAHSMATTVRALHPADVTLPSVFGRNPVFTNRVLNAEHVKNRFRAVTTNPFSQDVIREAYVPARFG